MIKKYTYGTPFPTESVTEQFAASEGMPEFGTIHLQEGFSFTYRLRDEDIVYGLGEANRGINKRGYQYIRQPSPLMSVTQDRTSFLSSVTGHTLLCMLSQAKIHTILQSSFGR